MKTITEFIKEGLNNGIAFEILITELEKTVKGYYEIKHIHNFGDEILINYINPDNLKKNYHGQMLNAIRLCYDIDGGVCELYRSGHLALSPYDREHDYKYLAMRNMKEMAKKAGVNVRKFGFKDEKDLAKKITKMANEIYDVCLAYCGGDEKQFLEDHTGTIDVDIKDAYKK